ncbi:MAG: glycosyltransferase family 2 protein [Candidatus Omnitrophica bacterium]|nr:glycosyltransferase family 2 protein [Candidatus Omnitrophota bacterium]
MKNLKIASEEKLSVCIPVYNGADTIRQTIQSILAQTFKDFELLIVDNASTDNTVNIVRSFTDNRIKLYLNEKNLGCGGNLEECKKIAGGDIVFYISADDIADKDALRRVYDAFQSSEDIGIVTRTYYWFSEDIFKAVRAEQQFREDLTVSINDSYDKVKSVIALSGQISGIAFRKKFMKYTFSNIYFVEMASMVISVLKDTKAIILKDNIVAVRTGASCCNPVFFENSSMMTWYNLIDEKFREDKFKDLKKYLVKNYIANNFVGLVQIKNYGTFTQLLREISYLIKMKWENIFNLQFWVFSIGSILVPGFILSKLVVFYKNKVNSVFLGNIKISLPGGWQ